MKKKINTSWVLYSFFMLISPVGGAITGLVDKGLNLTAKKWLLIIFVTLFGSVIFLKGDAHEHQETVEEHYVGLSFSEFSSELYEILTFQQPYGTTGDVYLHVLGYFVAEVLQMPALFFVLVGFVYGFFYIGSIFKVLRLLQGYKYTIILLSFLLAFLSWKTIHDMQTVRSWTGLWVMFYAGLSYFETGKKKYLGLLALPPLIHIGYFIMVIPAWIVAIFQNQKLIYASVFFISFFTQVVPEQWAISQISRVPIGVSKIKSYYLGQEKFEDRGEETTKSTGNQRFYKAYAASNLPLWGLFIPTFALIVFGAYFKSMSNLESLLFSTGLMAKAFSNGFFFIFALNNRLNVVSCVFILAAIILLLARGYNPENTSKLRERIEKLCLWTGWGLLVPYFIFKLAEFVNFGSFFLFLFPFVPWFSEVNFSLKEFILSLI